MHPPPPLPVRRAATTSGQTAPPIPAKLKRAASLPTQLSRVTGRTILKDMLERGGAPRTRLSSLKACVRDFDLVIMRGLPGAGKSTLIHRALADSGLDVDIASADLYFARGGTYAFDRAKLAQAHEYSQACAEIALRESRKVIVDNTNIKARDVNVYVDLAKKYGASVCVFEIPIPKTISEALELKNNHSVGPEVIERMYNDFEPTSRQLPVFHPKQQPLQERPGGAVNPRDVAYWGLFLTKKSQQFARQLCTTCSEIDGVEEIKGDHITLAHSARIQDGQELQISNDLSPHLGRRIKFKVAKVSFDDLSTVGVVQIVDDDIHLTRLAERANQRLHLTLSHRRGVKPARSVEILDSAEKLPSSVILTGVLGFWSKSSKRAEFGLNRTGSGGAISLPRQLTNNSDKIFVFDCDRTLLMTPSKSDFQRVTGRPWRGGGFFDNPKSLAANLPIFPGPALDTLHRLRTSVHGAKFVLLTGRIEAMEEAVRGALARFSADTCFDALYLRPKAARTAEWKAEVLSSIAASNLRASIISWDDDPVARGEMLAKLTSHGFTDRVQVQDEHFKC